MALQSLQSAQNPWRKCRNILDKVPIVDEAIDRKDLPVAGSGTTGELESREALIDMANRAGDGRWTWVAVSGT
jgi:hypothetical protein